MFKYYYWKYIYRLICFLFLSTDTLALPKLNLQFLTLHDYLLRNLNLFRLESTCMIDFSSVFCLFVFLNLYQERPRGRAVRAPDFVTVGPRFNEFQL